MAELLVRDARIVYPATRGFVVDRGWLLVRDGVISSLAAGPRGTFQWMSRGRLQEGRRSTPPA